MQRKDIELIKKQTCSYLPFLSPLEPYQLIQLQKDQATLFPSRYLLINTKFETFSGIFLVSIFINFPMKSWKANGLLFLTFIWILPSRHSRWSICREIERHLFLRLLPFIKYQRMEFAKHIWLLHEILES